MWSPGEILAWRGIYRSRIWHVQPTIVVRDSPEELVLTLLPGTECIAEENYPKGKKSDSRRWHYKERNWRLARYTWQANRLLLIFEPHRFYSTILFWDHASGNFRCYYINFQLPFQRRRAAVDTLDLDLDLVIGPDFQYEWKDREDYEQAVMHGVISPEWVEGIEAAGQEVLQRLEARRYPFDGAWLDWQPDPAWAPPALPEGWDRI